MTGAHCSLPVWMTYNCSLIEAIDMTLDDESSMIYCHRQEVHAHTYLNDYFFALFIIVARSKLRGY